MANTDISLSLCESICNRTHKYSVEILCEQIVEDVETRVMHRQFERTLIGRAIKSGVKVRFESRTYHEGMVA